MKSFIVLFGSALIVIGGYLPVCQGNVAYLSDGSGYIDDKILIQLRESAPALGSIYGINEILSDAGEVKIESLYKGQIRNASLRKFAEGLYIITIENKNVLFSAIDRLSTIPEIYSAEPYWVADLFYMPNDPYADVEWHLEHTHTLEAWDIVRGDTTRHSVVAVIDTGVRWDHPDMTANLWINYAEDLNHNNIPDAGDNNGTDDDGNGFVDDIWGWDFGSGDNNPRESSIEHGTAVAGSISEATDNGVMGAAIGFSAKVMVLKSFADNGNFYGYLESFIYAADNGAQIINCSWGIPTYSDIFQSLIDAVWAEDVLIIAAAGYEGDTPSYPAAYNYVMAVTATDNQDNIASFSSHGPFVDICAPGVNIYTIWGANDFIIVSGTSFSTAFVSGLAALVRAWAPLFTNDQTENLIIATADPISYPDFPGRINSYNCVMAVGADDRVENVPAQFSVNAYPNPFNAQTTISYSLPEASNISIEIFDITGRKVSSLFDGRQEAGTHSVTWDVGQDVTGVYFYKIKTADFTETKKCVLLK